MEVFASQRLEFCLREAVEAFNREDAETLLCPGRFEGEYDKPGARRWAAASERAISHRLAVHLEDQLMRYCWFGEEVMSVDCEYNRHGEGDKTGPVPKELKYIVERAHRTAKSATDDPNMFVFSVAPDIVVHRRGIDENWLAVEVKKTSNREFPRYDQLKLEMFTDQHGDYRYLLGAAIEAEDRVPPNERRLSIRYWVRDGKQEADVDQ